MIVPHWEKHKNLADIYCSFLVDWEILCKSPVFIFYVKEEEDEYNLKSIKLVSFFKNVYLRIWKVSDIQSLVCLV